MNVYFGKQTVKLKKDFTKVSKVGLPFHILTSIYATLNFWLSFRLVLLWKWNNNYPKTIQCKNLLRKTAKTCQFMRKKVLLKQTKKFKTLWSRDLWRHVPVLVLKKKNQVENYFPTNFLCYALKGWFSTALGLVSLLLRSCSLPP